MSTTTTEHIVLTSIRTSPPSQQSRPALALAEAEDPPENATYSMTAVPDGGYGWTIVLCGAMMAFWSNGIINCWGVLQAALLNSKLEHVPTSTLSFVGSLGLGLSAGLGILSIKSIRYVGSRITALLGVLIMGISLIGSGLCTRTSNVGGLFGTAGLTAGVGMSMTYTVSNILPVQYFSGRLGLANGLVKLGGGIGGCVMAIALDALNHRVGIQWTFMIQGLLTIGTGLPAAYFLVDRVPLRNTPFVDLEMFRSLPFVALFLAGVIGTFALFVPPYFLPLFAQSMGLSSSMGAGLVAAFNACNALGRFIAGPLCDRIGPVNMFLITMALQATSMLAIWPVSSSLGPLMVFAMLNGIGNGSFFTTLPTVAAGMFGPGRAPVAVTMSVAGWALGYFVGTPVAGYLLQAAGGDGENAGIQSIDVYRPAIFYAGGVATLSTAFVLFARMKMERSFKKRV
jgi:MFS family permease